MLLIQGIRSLTSEEMKHSVLQGVPRVTGKHWHPMRPSLAIMHKAERVQPRGTARLGRMAELELRSQQSHPQGLLSQPEKRLVDLAW